MMPPYMVRTCWNPYMRLAGNPRASSSGRGGAVRAGVFKAVSILVVRRGPDAARAGRAGGAGDAAFRRGRGRVRTSGPMALLGTPGLVSGSLPHHIVHPHVFIRIHVHWCFL